MPQCTSVLKILKVTFGSFIFAIKVRNPTTHRTLLFIDPCNDSSLFAKNLVKVGQAPPKIPTIMTDDMYTLVKKVACP